MTSKNGKRAEKWDPVTSALKAFFADPESAGITASLSLFPLNKNTGKGAADQSKPADCAASAYVTPEVPPTALPDDKTFAAAIAKIDPPNEFGTPTYPALSGTIEYAESLLKEDASRKVAIVMVDRRRAVRLRRQHHRQHRHGRQGRRGALAHLRDRRRQRAGLTEGDRRGRRHPRTRSSCRSTIRSRRAKIYSTRST